MAPAASKPATLRLLDSSRTPASPPAVWTAFAQQGVWKNWVILLQFVLLALLALGTIGLATRDPDVVLVDTSSGQSTYVNRSLAGEELARFLANHRQRPSSLTVAHFSREFLRSFLAVNSTTIDEEWQRSLSMMGRDFRTRVEREAEAQKLIETLRAARIRTDITFESLTLEEELPHAARVRAVLVRRKQSLVGGPTTADKVEVQLAERIVPRSPEHPDGLEVTDYRNKILPPVAPDSTEATAHVP